MAIGLDAYAGATFSGSGPYTMNFTCAGIQRLLAIVALGIRNSTSSWSWSAASYNGSAATQQESADSSGSSRNVRVGVWTLVNPTAGGSYVVSATPSVGLLAARIMVLSLTGVDQTTPVGATGTDAGLKAGYSASLGTGIADPWLIGGAGVRNGTLTWSPGTGVTELIDAPSGSSTTDDVAGFLGYRPCAAAGSYAFAATSSGVGSPVGALAAVEIRPATAAPAAWFGAEVAQSAAGVWMFQ